MRKCLVLRCSRTDKCRLNCCLLSKLSRYFRDLAINLGNYRFANWNTLTPTQRRGVEDEEWSLFNASADMTTKALGLPLKESKVNGQNIKSL
jgi:hypothetical protein